MIDYDSFLDTCKRMGLDPFSYLIPADVFKKITDVAQYNTNDIAHYLDMTERHARRILKAGNANFIKIHPFTCKGIEAKRAIYQHYYKYIIRNFPFKDHT